MIPGLLTKKPVKTAERIDPLCSVFGVCGGCAYQDVSYADELLTKQALVQELLQQELGLESCVFRPIVESPQSYGYRHRLDLTFRKTRAGEFLMGFMPESRKKVLEIDSCPIAMKPVSDYLPALKKAAIERLPQNYETANLVVRTGGDARVMWGGIGRHSLRMREEDYLWTEIEGRRIHFSLETFFQANLSILPVLIKTVRERLALTKDTVFMDLYSGVGLFGLCLAGEAGQIVMMEDYPASVKIARYNAAKLGLESKIEFCEARVEDALPGLLDKYRGRKIQAMIDPPRHGLKPEALETLKACAASGVLEKWLYLSCYPPALLRDLKELCAAGWQVQSVTPLDFFPRTKHLETLVELVPAAAKRLTL
ncbi:MAG: class I SAM-dependent RNA methyltransferase [Candidatus Omnitrophica bacterium]|nr:class I SAM-dependent RNA methyltransferase [Candidatus Omnitrophota bacterium]